jgi:hypothetical protein
MAKGPNASEQLVDVRANATSRATSAYRADRVPNECPVCHFMVEPEQAFAWVKTPSGTCEACYRCTRAECQSLFIAYYEPKVLEGRGTSPVLCLRSIAPWRAASDPKWEAMGTVSSAFVTIANQAAAAEHHDLVEVAGVGFRKALEFLVKDYLIGKGGDPTAIKAKPLGACIREDVDEPRLKLCAERAVWLGNDETHYVRKWEEFGLRDLKEVIALTVSWIDMELHTKALLERMPPKAGE